MTLQRTCMVGGILTTGATAKAFATEMLNDCQRARAGISEPRIVISSNGSVIARYHADEEFRDLVDRADLVDADGMPLVLASRLLSRSPLPERIATTDFVHVACRVAEEAGLSFYFLGGSEENNRRAADYFRDRYPNLTISGRRDGYFDSAAEPKLCDEIVALRTDVLWVGLGSPLQEQFVHRNRQRLRGVGWLRTCGGLFDHYSGKIPRAPQAMQQLGLEWLFRASLEPRRLGRRYLETNGPALFHLVTKTR